MATDSIIAEPPSAERGRSPAAFVARGLDAWLVTWQVARLARARLLRWRLETYGVYMPSLPGARPWWRVNRRTLLILLRRHRAYGRWLSEIRATRAAGGHGWWRARLGANASKLDAYVAAANCPELE